MNIITDDKASKKRELNEYLDTARQYSIDDVVIQNGSIFRIGKYFQFKTDGGERFNVDWLRTFTAANRISLCGKKNKESVMRCIIERKLGACSGLAHHMQSLDLNQIEDPHRQQMVHSIERSPTNAAGGDMHQDSELEKNKLVDLERIKVIILLDQHIAEKRQEISYLCRKVDPTALELEMKNEAFTMLTFFTKQRSKLMIENDQEQRQ